MKNEFKEVVLQIRVLPPNGLKIEKIDTLIGGRRIIGDTDQLDILTPFKQRLTFSNCVLSHNYIGFVIT